MLKICAWVFGRPKRTREKILELCREGKESGRVGRVGASALLAAFFLAFAGGAVLGGLWLLDCAVPLECRLALPYEAARLVGLLAVMCSALVVGNCIVCVVWVALMRRLGIVNDAYIEFKVRTSLKPGG